MDFTAAGSTAPVKTGTLAARPAGCTRGQIYFATDVTAGQNLYLCTATITPGTWTVPGGSGSGSGSSVACSLASSLGFQLNGTDETTLLNSTLASATVSCLAIDAWKALRADGQIIMSATHPFRITGSTSAGYVGPSGSVLDLRYAGASNGGAKLYSPGGLSSSTAESIILRLRQVAPIAIRSLLLRETGWLYTIRHFSAGTGLMRAVTMRSSRPRR